MRRITVLLLAGTMAMMTACGSSTEPSLGNHGITSSTSEASSEETTTTDEKSEIEDTQETTSTQTEKDDETDYSDDATLKDRLEQDCNAGTTTVSFGSREGMKKEYDYYHFFDMTLPSGIDVTFASESNPDADTPVLQTVEETLSADTTYSYVNVSVKNLYYLDISAEMLNEAYSAENLEEDYEGDDVTIEAVEMNGLTGFLVYPASEDVALEQLHLYLNIGDISFRDTPYSCGIEISAEGKMITGSPEHYRALAEYLESLLEVSLEKQ